MVQIQIPITQATVFIFFGTGVAIGSIVSLLTVSPFFRTTFEVTLWLLSWFFLFFGSMFIFIGIRRLSPLD